jgi:hypothetical protein
MKKRYDWGDAAYDLEAESRYYGEMYRSIIHYRPQIVADQFGILHHVFILGDLFTELDESPPKTLKIIRLEIPLLIRQWIGFRICNYVGAYSAAARTLRWIYESTLASTVAVTNASLLLGKTTTKPMSESQFRKWLWKYDHQTVTFPRRDAIGAIGLSQKDQTRYNDLYTTLCKFSHVSAKHFVHPGWIPDLQLNLKDFDAVSRYAYRTMDLALYGIIKAIVSQWDVKVFLRGYREWFRPDSAFAVRREKFPLTIAILRKSI